MHTETLLATYLARIAYEGPLEVSYDTLSALQHAHMQAIAFENLDVVLGRPIRIDLDSVHDKLVTRRRGGYCFEHNTLFRAVLEALGFRVTALGARVQLGVAPDVVPPRTHMCLRVDLREGSFLADAGFGGAGPRQPLALEHGASVRVLGEQHRLTEHGGTWRLASEHDGAFHELYAFQLEPQHAIDFEVANHYTATHPSSRFVRNVQAQRFTSDGSVGVLNRVLTLRTGTQLARRELRDREELVTVLRTHLELDVPELAGVRVPAIPEWS